MNKLLEIAALETECQTCGGDGAFYLSWAVTSPPGQETPCPDCHGTGKVPLVAGLRRTCCTPEYPCWRQGGKQCKNWLPVSEPEAALILLAELIRRGYKLDWRYQHYGKSIGERFYLAWSDEHPAECDLTTGKTIIAAAHAALVQEAE